MEHFDPAVVPLPSCPSDDVVGVALSDYLAYPSVSIVYAVVALLSAVFALVALVKYNAVEVYNVKVRKASISNSYWIAYFASVAIRSAVDAAEYALAPRLAAPVLEALVVSSLALNVGSLLALALALNHQRRHRSSFAPRDTERAPSALAGNAAAAAPRDRAVTEASALLVPAGAGVPLVERVRGAVASVEAVFLVLALAVMAALAVLFSVGGDAAWVAWLVLYGVQRLPIVVLLTIILINRNESEGPGPLNKLIVLSAALLALVNDLPVTVWAEILAASRDSVPRCVFVVASWVDAVHLAYALGQILFFLFLKREFDRNKEECIWRIVSEQREQFDFRDF